MSILSGIQRALDKAWQTRSPKMEWLMMETVQRDVFDALKADEITERQALSLINDSIAAFTRRGHPTDRYHTSWISKTEQKLEQGGE